MTSKFDSAAYDLDADDWYVAVSGKRDESIADRFAAIWAEELDRLDLAHADAASVGRAS